MPETAPRDQETASAFASSWNNVREGSVYTRDQFLDWFAPLGPGDLQGATVIELGYGNGSLLFHVASCGPGRLVGVELGDTSETARRNLAHAAVKPELISGDLCAIDAGSFDVVYCIGVLHHLKDPRAGFESVLRHTRAGGRFHCWVYGYEGNEVVRLVVEPVRRLASRLPWWITKYLIAAPLVAPYFVFARLQGFLHGSFPGTRKILSKVPLFDYTEWIRKRPFWFFHHVAFDQLVTPQTVYLKEGELRRWLEAGVVDPASIYVIRRNGNSWKFGGRRRRQVPAPATTGV